MRRREVIGFAGTTLFAGPLIARAQQGAKIARVGVLAFGAPLSASRTEALRAALRDLGYVEGKNLVIEFRWADTVEQLHERAAELVHMKVDIIYANSSTESEAARRATTTIPIVFSTHFDPVGVGHVASLARPGGNITGMAALGTELTAKQLELLRATVPRDAVRLVRRLDEQLRHPPHKVPFGVICMAPNNSVACSIDMVTSPA